MLLLFLSCAFVIFSNMFLKNSYRAFLKSVVYRVLPIFLVIVWYTVCKFMCYYDIMVFFSSTFFSQLVYFFIAYNISMCKYFV